MFYLVAILFSLSFVLFYKQLFSSRLKKISDSLEWFGRITAYILNVVICSSCMDYCKNAIDSAEVGRAGIMVYICMGTCAIDLLILVAVLLFTALLVFLKNCKPCHEKWYNNNVWV